MTLTEANFIEEQENLMEGKYFDSFGGMLRTYRKRRKMTQRELAKKIGLHYNTISAWELGNYLPHSRTIVIELARLLGLDTQETNFLLESSLNVLSSLWNVPYPRNSFFTGRDEILQYLHNVFQQDDRNLLTRSYVLRGPCGMGKTQVAIEYVYRYYQEYAAVFWVQANTSANIDTYFRNIANQLHLSDQSEQAVIRWLTNHSNWFLVLDDIRSVKNVINILPAARDGFLLLTTRLQSLGNVARVVDVGPMHIDEGAYFLLQRANLLVPGETLDESSPLDHANACNIAKTLDGFPLALDRIGAYIEEKKFSLLTFSEVMRLLGTSTESIQYHCGAPSTL